MLQPLQALLKTRQGTLHVYEEGHLSLPRARLAGRVGGVYSPFLLVCLGCWFGFVCFLVCLSCGGHWCFVEMKTCN